MIKFRHIIAFNLERESPFLYGEVEVDESHFGVSRKGKHGRGADGKTPEMGLLKGGCKVYSQIISEIKSALYCRLSKKKYDQIASYKLTPFVVIML